MPSVHRKKTYLYCNKLDPSAFFQFHLKIEGDDVAAGQIRGLGTDVAIVSSMVFLAQFLLSICMGSVVTLAGTTTAVVCVASALAFCGALSATRVLYLNL